MKKERKNAVSLGNVHTHTHTHTSSLLKKEKGAIIPYVLVVCLFILTIRNSRIYKHKQ